MAMSNVTISILDATGKSVVSKSTVPASGLYGPITLTGTGPFRLWACGNAADKTTCLFSVTQTGGTTNLTPLTSAIVLLASGAVPTSPMSGAVVGLDSNAVAAAQTQLQTALAPAFSDAGLASSTDLITSALNAGSRTGYDRLLDDLNVSFGQDASPYVQIDARLGSGSLTLSSSGSAGQITIDPAAASLDLSGITTLFNSMNTAVATTTAATDACDAAMPALTAPNAHMKVAGISFTGTDVATGICGYIGPKVGGGLLSDGTFNYGTKLPSPQLGRCDFSGVSGSSAVCHISMVAQTPTGALIPFALNQAVAWQGGSNWLFLGDMQPFPTSADARAQRLRRVDGGNQVDSYARGIGVKISTLSLAACASVSQRDQNGNDVLLAYYKPVSGAENLSVWNVDAVNNQVSLDPTTGALRGADDSWIPLPDGTAGDATIRNFNAGGHAVKVSLFGDSACSTPLTPVPTGGADIFSVDLPGLPPLSVALPNLPWPTLATASATTLGSLQAAAGAKPTYTANWTFSGQQPGMSNAQLCTDSLCSTPSALIGSLAVAPGALTAAVPIVVGSTAIVATDFKQLRLNARGNDGLLLSADFQSCSTASAGSGCAVSVPLRQAAKAKTRLR